MKNKLLKLLSALICLWMLLIVLPLGQMSVSAAGGVKAKLDTFMSSYPSGSRWTKTFDGGSQCYGFAKLVVYNVFGASNISGYTYRSWSYEGVSTSGMNVIGSITNYSSSNVKSLLSQAKSGDVLQFDETNQHSMIVYQVDSDGVWIYDCNWDNNCGISLRKSSFGARSGRKSAKLTLLRANNYNTVDGTVVTHKVNSSYGKNFTAYPKAKITAANIWDANHNQVSSSAWIGTSDKCTIHEVYTDGCCKVSYPLDSGGTKTVYCKASLFNIHTHSYTGTRVYEAAHPHAITQRCTSYSSCGGYKVTGEYAKVTTCKQCWCATFDVSASSVSLKAGESKSISMTISGVWPDAALIVSDYDTGRLQVTLGKNTVTFKGLKAGTCSYKITIYSDSTKSYVIGSKSISVTVKDTTYAIKYNANGGNGAPADQTKSYNVTLTLSTTKPKRSGYTFLGWSTSSTATAATYQAGDKFTSNTDTTLYAVWKKGCENNSHTYSYKVTKAPTTSAAGTLTGTCSYCSATTTVSLPKLSTSSYNYSVTKAAGCTATGTGRYTWKTTAYGTFFFDISISATGHSYGAWNYSDSTYHIRYCSKCEHWEKAAHNYGDFVSVNDTVHARTCSTCKNQESKAHSWNGGVQTKAPSCKETGVKTYTCTTCSTTKTETIAKTANHIYGSWNVIKAPSCIEKGSETRICSICKKSEIRDVAATGHKIGSWFQVKAPTCIANGVEQKKCVASGCTYCETRDVAATGHNMGSWAQIKAPTCTEKGIERKKCNASGCTHSETREIAETGHSLSNWQKISHATCEDTGEESRSCSKCALKESKTIDALGHHFLSPTIIQNPTCTEFGVEGGKCLRCDKETSNLIPATGHMYAQAVIVKQATETEQGLQTETCTVCGDVKEEVIAVLSPTSNVNTDKGEGEKQEKSNNSLWLTVAVAASVMIAGAIGSTVAIKKRKKR